MFKGNVPIWALYALAAYFVTFVFIAGGLFLWWAKRRKERPPEKFKLLRGPGETQRRRVQKADEDMLQYFVFAAFAPIVAAGMLLLVAARLPNSFLIPIVVAAVLIFALTFVLSLRRLFQFLQRRRNDLLGYLGERAVAEQLDVLRSKGFRVFHDVPAEGRKKDFNIDQVVVGPTGVTTIEVKTRRKRKGREGYKDYEVTCDGQRLIWPWGEERWGIDQLQAEMDWLRKFIHGRTGLHIDPRPILALPGWWVTERAVGTFRVTNAKLLPAIVRDWKPQSLTSEQIDLISRQLDERCRDVED
jgi:Nuclease-related domain